MLTSSLDLLSPIIAGSVEPSPGVVLQDPCGGGLGVLRVDRGRGSCAGAKKLELSFFQSNVLGRDPGRSQSHRQGCVALYTGGGRWCSGPVLSACLGSVILRVVIAEGYRG